MMVLACNTFIEQAEYRPHEAPTAEDPALLTEEMNIQAGELRKVRPRRIAAALPGSLALRSPVDYGRHAPRA